MFNQLLLQSYFKLMKIFLLCVNETQHIFAILMQRVPFHPKTSSAVSYLNRKVRSEQIFGETYGVGVNRAVETACGYYRVSSDPEYPNYPYIGGATRHVSIGDGKGNCIRHPIGSFCYSSYFLGPRSSLVEEAPQSYTDRKIRFRVSFPVSSSSSATPHTRDCVKLLEYNADSAGTLFECGRVQGKWSEAVGIGNVGTDAGTSLQESVVRAWRGMKIPATQPVHFLVDDDPEEVYNATFMQELASLAGVSTKLCVGTSSLGWKNLNGSNTTLCHEDGEPLRIVWKMWAWIQFCRMP